MGKKIVISESERQQIRQMYKLAEKQDYVFDFVLTKNNKYLIIMDELFVAGGNGKSIGSIWENTYVFNEILKESIKNNIVTESIDEILKTVEWKKEQIREWIKENDVITEGIKDIAQKVFRQGILPFLHWVRRSLNTGIGIVVDVVISILSARSNVIIWFIVVLLDIYEMVSGDYDPKDPLRQQMPYFLLLADLLGCAFTSAAAVGARKAAQKIATQGLHKGAPWMVKMVEKLVGKLPSLKKTLLSTADFLSSKFGKNGVGVISKMKGGIESVLSGMEKFLSQLLRPSTSKAIGAVQSGGTALAGVKGMEAAVPIIDKSGKIGKGIMSTEKGLERMFGSSSPELSQYERDAISQFAGLPPITN